VHLRHGKERHVHQNDLDTSDDCQAKNLRMPHIISSGELGDKVHDESKYETSTFKYEQNAD
jgi:hypothetical protein